MTNAMRQPFLFLFHREAHTKQHIFSVYYYYRPYYWSIKIIASDPGKGIWYLYIQNLELFRLGHCVWNGMHSQKILAACQRIPVCLSRIERASSQFTLGRYIITITCVVTHCSSSVSILDAYFWIGKSGDPSPSGVIVPYPDDYTDR